MICLATVFFLFFLALIFSTTYDRCVDKIKKNSLDRRENGRMRSSSKLKKFNMRFECDETRQLFQHILCVCVAKIAQYHSRDDQK